MEAGILLILFLIVIVPAIFFIVSLSMINSGDVKKARIGKVILFCLGILLLIGFSICSNK